MSPESDNTTLIHVHMSVGRKSMGRGSMSDSDLWIEPKATRINGLSLRLPRLLDYYYCHPNLWKPRPRCLHILAGMTGSWDGEDQAVVGRRGVIGHSPVTFPKAPSTDALQGMD